jgi:hypothetical protein
MRDTYKSFAWSTYNSFLLQISYKFTWYLIVISVTKMWITTTFINWRYNSCYTHLAHQSLKYELLYDSSHDTHYIKYKLSLEFVRIITKIIIPQAFVFHIYIYSALSIQIIKLVLMIDYAVSFVLILHKRRGKAPCWDCPHNLVQEEYCGSWSGLFPPQRADPNSIQLPWSMAKDKRQVVRDNTKKSRTCPVATSTHRCIQN